MRSPRYRILVLALCLVPAVVIAADGFLPVLCEELPGADHVRCPTPYIELIPEQRDEIFERNFLCRETEYTLGVVHGGGCGSSGIRGWSLPPGVSPTLEVKVRGIHLPPPCTADLPAITQFRCPEPYVELVSDGSETIYDSAWHCQSSGYSLGALGQFCGGGYGLEAVSGWTLRVIPVSGAADLRAEIMGHVVDPCYLDMALRNPVEGVSTEKLIELAKMVAAKSVNEMVGESDADRSQDPRSGEAPNILCSGEGTLYQRREIGMRKVGGIIALTAGIFGVSAAGITLVFGGLGASFKAADADTVFGLWWGGIAFSFLAIILGVVAMRAKGWVPGALLVACAIAGALLGGPLVAIFMAFAAARRHAGRDRETGEGGSAEDD